MVAVAFKRYLFTRASNYKALTGKILMFWIYVVAYGRWSRMKARLYTDMRGIAHRPAIPNPINIG